MVVAIEGMEVCLKASMKENRNQEITEMENRLKLNMKEVIESSIQRAIDTMGNTIHQMIANNPTVHSTSSEVSVLKEENQRLKQELQYLSAEQGKLENRMERMESRHLENCVIIRGLREEYRETDEAGRIKIYSELSNLFTEESAEERYNMACRLVIQCCKRLGRFNRDRHRPFSVEFVHHEDVSFIMENRSYLSEGVFVNHEFSAEVERKRRTMLPILRAARHIESYKKQIRLEKDKVVIKGKDYDMGNIHELPGDLNAFKVTSKENENVVGYFGELNTLKISSLLSSLLMASNTSPVSSISRPQRPTISLTQMLTTKLWAAKHRWIVKNCQEKSKESINQNGTVMQLIYVVWAFERSLSKIPSCLKFSSPVQATKELLNAPRIGCGGLEPP